MRTGVLLSGGLDSAVLLVDESTRGDVQPIYISAGLAWEPGERAVTEQFLSSGVIRARITRPLVPLSIDMSDVYAATHWAMQGKPPGYDTPDEDVYLPGRNIVLIGKAAVYCAAAGIGRLVLGTLAGNPFPDATPEFREALARALSLGLAYPLAVETPYARLSKADVIRRGVSLGVPLELTLSCMNVPGVASDRPSRSIVHCGACSKCRERHDAFLEAGIEDPTEYVERAHLGRHSGHTSHPAG
jgi:7-cyano-7-deazaguanine synthase